MNIADYRIPELEVKLDSLDSNWARMDLLYQWIKSGHINRTQFYRLLTRYNWED